MHTVVDTRFLIVAVAAYELIRKDDQTGRDGGSSISSKKTKRKETQSYVCNLNFQFQWVITLTHEIGNIFCCEFVTM